MVVEDHDVHAAVAQPGDAFDGGGAAIHGDEQAGGVFFQTGLHGALAEAVALVHAVRQVTGGREAEARKGLEQQGGGTNAVHVVVTEDDHGLAGGAGAEQARDRGVHRGQQKGISQGLEAGFEVGGEGVGFAVAAIEEALGEQGRDAQAGGELVGEQRIGRGEGPAEFHGVAAGVVRFP